MPSAMAPLETTTKTVPSFAAMAVAIDSKTRPPPASVREPIFTTTRRDRATAARAVAGSNTSTMRLDEQLVEGRFESVHRLGGKAGGEAEKGVDEDIGRVPLVVDGRTVGERRGDDRQRAEDRAVDGEPHAPRLFDVDADGSLGTRKVE